MTPSFEDIDGNVPGVLLTLNDIDEKTDAEFNRWYQQEHLVERLQIDGFIRARRYKAVDGQPAYMAVYDCQSIEVLASGAYRERLANPTVWTKRIMPSFRNTLRAACRETWSTGVGIGGAVILVQCKPVKGMEDKARRYIKENLAPCVMQSGGAVHVALWEADAEVTVGSAEMELRSTGDNYAHWILFVEAYDLAQLALALHARILTGEGAYAGLLIGSWTRYQLTYERTA